VNWIRWRWAVCSQENYPYSPVIIHCAICGHPQRDKLYVAVFGSIEDGMWHSPQLPNVYLKGNEGIRYICHNHGEMTIIDCLTGEEVYIPPRKASLFIMTEWAWGEIQHFVKARWQICRNVASEVFYAALHPRRYLAFKKSWD